MTHVHTVYDTGDIVRIKINKVRNGIYMYILLIKTILAFGGNAKDNMNIMNII